MEYILRPIYQERASHPDTLGIILINKRDDELNRTNNFDSILLIIVKNHEKPIFTKHYMYGDMKMAMHIVTEQRLRKWLFIGSNRNLVNWIFYGKVIFDRNEFVYKLRSELQEFPFNGRKIKTGIQFSKLIHRYLEGKKLFEHGDYLDAYHHVVHSMHHLARMSVIDNGIYPEVTVWSQVKKIEPAIYKLYEELVTSTESIEKRLELLFLASEFMINSRTRDGAQHLIETMLEQETWTIQDLHNHPDLKYYATNLEIFIEYLIDKGYILVEPLVAKNATVFHRLYKVSKEFVAEEYGM